MLCMQPLSNYLDASDLAVLLKVTPATILRRARTKPQSLPPPAALGPNFPLRWKQTDVANWLNALGMDCYRADAHTVVSLVGMR